MKFRHALRGILIFWLCLACASQGYGSDWKFAKPGSKAGEFVSIEENDVGIVAMDAILAVLNELLRSNDKSQESYRRYFGVEPEGRYTDMSDKETSGFLNCLFANLDMDASPASELTLSISSKAQCWKLFKTGDYTTFAAIINVRGSRYQRAFMMIRVEIQEIQGSKIAFATPSAFYVSLK